MDTITIPNKKILITGGNGYLGSQLAKTLTRMGADISIVDNTPTGKKNEIIVDITDKESLSEVIKKIRPQIVFHLAAILDRNRSFEDYSKTHLVNYTGTLNLLYAMNENKCEKIIFTSTSEIYGPNTPPFNENQIPLPVSPYSLTKANAESAIRTFSELYGLKYTILRLFNFYGDGMPESFFIPELLKALKTKESFETTGGKQHRDFLHISNVVQALLLSIENKRAENEVFNVCSGKSTTLRDLILGFKAALNSKCNISFGALPYRTNEVWNMVGDNSKIRDKLGFKVTHNIESLTQLAKCQ